MFIHQSVWQKWPNVWRFDDRSVYVCQFFVPQNSWKLIVFVHFGLIRSLRTFYFRRLGGYCWIISSSSSFFSYSLGWLECIRAYNFFKSSILVYLYGVFMFSVTSFGTRASCNPESSRSTYLYPTWVSTHFPVTTFSLSRFEATPCRRDRWPVRCGYFRSWNPSERNGEL